MDARVQEYVTRYELAVAFAKAMVAELGEEEALPIIQRAWNKLQAREGRKLAERLGTISLAALAEDCRRMAAELPNFRGAGGDRSAHRHEDDALRGV